MTCVSDFENGHNFGVILEKLNLSRGKKFKNSTDMACVFHNYKNVKDLLMEEFGVDFPINNIIYSTEKMLITLRNECVKYARSRKENTLRTASLPQGVSTMLPQEKKMFAHREREITMNSKLETSKPVPKKIVEI